MKATRTQAIVSWTLAAVAVIAALVTALSGRPDSTTHLLTAAVLFLLLGEVATIRARLTALEKAPDMQERPLPRR